jgi:transposase
LICGLRRSGVTAPFAVEGTTDAPLFQAYAEQVLAPELHPGDVVIWDNLKPHQAAGVVPAVEAVGAHVLRLPPYSPDLTPIEKMDSKVKGFLRSAKARTIDVVYEAMKGGLQQVRPADILGWFRSCGLCPGQKGQPPGCLIDRDRSPPGLCATHS